MAEFREKRQHALPVLWESITPLFNYRQVLSGKFRVDFNENTRELDIFVGKWPFL